MVIVDFSQVMIANLMMNLFVGKNTDAVHPDFLRHMILNTTRAIRVKFKAAQWGELVLACDDKEYWRRDIFPYYKAARKKARAESGLDWTTIFQHLDQFKTEIKENFPYRMIQVPKCEADDIIATLCIDYGYDGPLNMGEPLKIVSGDQDFMMLQRYGNVSQYDQIHKKDVICSTPELERSMLILRGDSGDGVPNILSQDDCFVQGIKQKPLRKDRIEELLNTRYEQLPEAVQKRWKRNEALVDLFVIPSEYRAKILSEFALEANKPRDKMLSYMMSKRLKLLIEHLGEF